MQNYGWEILPVCHYPGKFRDQRHCDNGDVFNISHNLTRLHFQRVI